MDNNETKQGTKKKAATKKEILKARHQEAVVKCLLPREGSKNWIKPRSGRYRLDVDYGIDEQGRCGGVGALVRDSKGNIIFAMAKPVMMSSSILHGEVKAMMYGICQCIEEELSPVEVYSDSLLAVMAVREKNEEVSVLYEDLFDFFKRVLNLNVLSIDHVRREANKAAHELACFAKSISSTFVWHGSWPIGL